MKIYHPESEEDYDSLTVELEKQGITTAAGRPLRDWGVWHVFKEETCIDVRGHGASAGDKYYYREVFPQVPITTYKAKKREAE